MFQARDKSAKKPQSTEGRNIDFILKQPWILCLYFFVSPVQIQVSIPV